MYLLYPDKAATIVTAENALSTDILVIKIDGKHTDRKSTQAVSLMSLCIAACCTAYKPVMTLLPLAKKDLEYHASRAKFSDRMLLQFGFWMPIMPWFMRS